jgi:hypothetical protein
MNFRIGLALAVVVLFTGCSTPPQRPVAFSASGLSAPQGNRIGVAMTALPKVDTHLPGADCLLCLAAASLANSSLTAHARTLPYEDLPKLKDEVAQLLRKKGAQQVSVIAEDVNVEDLPSAKAQGPDVAVKDFSSFQKKYDVDKLLVIDVRTLGFQRYYKAYIPSGDPRALLQGAGYLVNLSNNTYEWYSTVYVSRGAEGKWDEPPKFPGLTNAYFQVIELAKERFTQPFTTENVAAQ